MAVQTTLVNKPLNPRGNDQSPLAYNRAKLFSGKALDFDGVNDYVDCGTLDVTAYTAISMSFNLKLANVSDTDRILSLKHTGIDDIRFLQVSNRLLYTLDDGTAYSLTSPELVANEWFKIDMTFNGTTLKGYLNGVEFGSMAASFDFSTADGLLYLFRHTEAAAYAEGEMAGFKIFNTALTAAQVADLYNNPEKVVPTGVDNTALKLWLPMQEGAGTTAYDGSGNGNHGAVSGASWLHGIGAPVSQTAVIDWNKGTNILEYTENPDDNGNFLARGFTKNSSTETSPIGTNDAHKYTEDGTNSNPGLVYLTDYSSGSSQTFKVYLKADAATSLALSTTGSVVGGNINVTTEWQQFEVTQSVNSTSGPHIGGFATITQGSGIVLYMWHPQMSYGDSVYIPTIATAQTSPVLLPQGLTTGRDITGVNLFENVRKQGALNLDGNSWAEVHDNASLDITDAISVECWINSTDKDQYHHIISKNKSADANYAIIAEVTTGYLGFEIIGGELKKTDYNVMDGNWNHVVVTYDETNLNFYVNGVLDETIAYTSAIPTNSVDVYIGARPEGVQLYEADIAQPRIYNRALTAEEVQRNYNAGKNTYTN